MELIRQSNYKVTKKIINYGKYQKILIIAGAKSFVKSRSQNLINSLIIKKKTKLFLRKKTLPEYKELKKLIVEIKRFKPDLLIAIGGGAVLDLAKVANSLTFEKNLKKKITLNKYKAKNFTDLFAIPTTAGSGAEVTTNAVIYINKVKYSIESDLIKPKHMALFPELIISNKNQKVINSSAFDCFAQSVESLFSKKSNKQSINYSKKSIYFFLKNYHKFIKIRSLKSGYEMSLAAYYSGKAISISKTTAPHAVSYPFTSYYNISHGHAVSLTLKEMLEYNYQNSEKSTAKYNLKERYKILFNLLSVKNIKQLSKKISFIKKKLNLEKKLSKINKQIPKNLNKILKNINLQRLNNNPVEISKKDLKQVLKKIS